MRSDGVYEVVTRQERSVSEPSLRTGAVIAFLPPHPATEFHLDPKPLYLHTQLALVASQTEETDSLGCPGDIRIEGAGPCRVSGDAHRARGGEDLEVDVSAVRRVSSAADVVLVVEAQSSRGEAAHDDYGGHVLLEVDGPEEPALEEGASESHRLRVERGGLAYLRLEQDQQQRREPPGRAIGRRGGRQGCMSRVGEGSGGVSSRGAREESAKGLEEGQ